MAYSRFDYTQWGTGLDSQGLPRDSNKVYDFYKQVAANPSTPYNKGILSGIQAYGKNNPGSVSDPTYVTNALDWYWRDIQRKSQKENGFFQSLPGKIVGIGATALGSVLGGPIGGAIAGGITGGLGSKSVLGGLTGALGGYFGGGLLNKVGIPTNVLNLPGGGTVSGLFSGIKALGSSAPLTSVNNLMPAAYSSRALGTATGLAGNVGSFVSGGSSAANAAGTGGSGMGWFTDLLKESAPNIIGGAVQGGLNYYGNQQATKAETDAANRLAASMQFKPYNVSGPAGGAAFSGNTATGVLSPEMQKQLAQMQGITSGALSDYNKFNTNNYAQNYYDTITKYKQPEDQAQTNDLLNRVYATGNWGSTVGAKDVYSYQQAKAMEDNMLRIQAQQAGASEQDRLFNRYFKAAGSQQSLATLPYQFINQGGTLGGSASNAAVQAGSYPWMAAQNSADASQAFWSTIGGVAGNQISSVLNKYGSYSSNNNRPITLAPSLGSIGGYGSGDASSLYSPSYGR